MKKKVAIFGSTGSIGTQTLEILRQQSDRFELSFLVAGSNKELLEQQCEEFSCMWFLAGDFSTAVEMTVKVDIVVMAIPGEDSIEPTIEALKQGKRVLLASKEALVCAGEEIMAIKTGELLPVDSELAAIWQCLEGRKIEDVEKVILTASGGPFFGMTREDLKKVSLEDALKHPTWEMGQEITINSATLMNKGFEVMEVHHLFGLPYDQIEVVVHPQSLVHGIVIFKDGNILMHVAANDMKIPLNWALNYPETIDLGFKKFDFVGKKLEFFAPDLETFPALARAYNAGHQGSLASRDLLAQNRTQVESFIRGEKSFLEIC